MNDEKEDGREVRKSTAAIRKSKRTLLVISSSSFSQAMTEKEGGEFAGIGHQKLKVGG
jgi:hypothetical protein